MNDPSSGGLDLEAVFQRIRTNPDFPYKEEFELFLSAFNSLCREVYNPVPDTLVRYKCAFKIVALGNLAKGMKLVPKKEQSSKDRRPVDDREGIRIRASLGLTSTEIKFFDNLSLLRNLIADAFHGVDKKDTDEIIKSIIEYLKAPFFLPTLVSNFKKNFQRLTNEKKIGSLLNDQIRLGKEKDFVTKLFKQIKYFFAKSKYFFDLGETEASAMAYLAGCSGVRNFNQAFTITENKKDEVKKGGRELTFEEFEEFYKDREHIKNIIDVFDKLQIVHREHVAHVYESHTIQKMHMFLRKNLHDKYDDEFVNKLFPRIDIYLKEKYGVTDLEYEPDSPRGFDPEIIKKRPPKDIQQNESGGSKKVEARVEKQASGGNKSKEIRGKRERGDIPPYGEKGNRDSRRADQDNKRPKDRGERDWKKDKKRDEQDRVPYQEKDDDKRSHYQDKKRDRDSHERDWKKDKKRDDRDRDHYKEKYDDKRPRSEDKKKDREDGERDWKKDKKRDDRDRDHYKEKYDDKRPRSEDKKKDREGGERDWKKDKKRDEQDRVPYQEKDDDKRSHYQDKKRDRDSHERDWKKDKKRDDRDRDHYKKRDEDTRDRYNDRGEGKDNRDPYQNREPYEDDRNRDKEIKEPEQKRMRSPK